MKDNMAQYEIMMKDGTKKEVESDCMSYEGGSIILTTTIEEDDISRKYRTDAIISLENVIGVFFKEG